MINQPLVFLDVESTGGSVADDRITEIGLIVVENGEVIQEWSTLINPQRPIPPFIVRYIGIDDEMVADAPRFADIAEELQAILANRVLVAHNARFDYSFLRHEFRLANRRYHANVLCTVKLSRRLYPKYQKHNLDALIKRHNLACDARHRAMGEARVLWEFIQWACTDLGAGPVAEQVETLIQRMPVPPGLPIDAFDDLPETAGVYIFRESAQQALVIGKGKNLRAKVLAQLTPGSGNSRSQEIQQRVTQVEWIETVGIIGAELEELRLVEQWQPEFNSNLSVADTETTRLVDIDSHGCRLEFLSADQLVDGGDCYGLFRNRDDALVAIQAALDKHPVCTQGLALAGLVCPVHGAAECAGHDQADPLRSAKIRLAFARLKLPEWPFEGPVYLQEQQAWPQKTRVHLFERWCYLGYEESEQALSVLLDDHPVGEFSLSVYRLLKRLLEQPKTAATFIPVKGQF